MEMAPRSDSSSSSVAIDPFTRGSRRRRRRRRLRHQEIRHCQRAASPSLKANPSPARVAVASSAASTEDIAAFQAVGDGLVGKMYRFRERRRLELQQQQCKSSRRTVEDRGSVASSEGGKVVSLNGGNCDGSTSDVYGAALGRRSRRGGHFWVASAGRPNVLLAVVLFLLAGFCTQSGCDDTEQFQKNSE